MLQKELEEKWKTCKPLPLPTKEKLTFRECCLYYNAQIKYYAQEECTIYPSLENFLLSNLHNFISVLWDGNCKLLGLKALDNITVDEKVFLAKIVNINLRELELLIFSVTSNNIVINFSSDFTFAQFKSFVDWCRGKNFDVDKCKERGVAV